MKGGIEIILRTIHVGSARRVVTLGLDGKDLAEEFLTNLARKDAKGFEFIRSRVRAVAEHDTFENQLTFRHVGEGVFEFKRPGLRLYAFYDTLPGLQPQLIVSTNGGRKNNGQATDIARAKQLRARYLAARACPDTTIKLITLSHED